MPKMMVSQSKLTETQADEKDALLHGVSAMYVFISSSPQRIFGEHLRLRPILDTHNFSSGIGNAGLGLRQHAFHFHCISRWLKTRHGEFARCLPASIKLMYSVPARQVRGVLLGIPLYPSMVVDV